MEFEVAPGGGTSSIELQATRVIFDPIWWCRRDKHFPELYAPGVRNLYPLNGYICAVARIR
jgi:hypothetical protein